MGLARVEKVSGKPPNQWKVVRYADVGASEEFVRQFDELNQIFGGVSVAEPQREQAREAIITVLMEGLIPAFLDIKRIRESAGKDLPLLDQYQMYEDFAGKAWKAYKELMQQAAKKMGFEIGFLFQPEPKFETGLKKFRESNPSVPGKFEEFVRNTRAEWQNDLKDFRNSVEHQTVDRNAYKKFYDPSNAETLFELVWRTTVEILAMLLFLHLPKHLAVVDHVTNDPNRSWPNRFQFHLIGVKLR